ncbi:DUF4342 domain-containing protein [Tumebacillus flagellatus]|uniref:DUF4342 domain-containing protein n=1 Tax=Tumebacillus flagellatus TaxID=1157490 RepID=A0A074LRR7_9BACL|nr:DUF4342 domain-containing protein [Tumebacillus flagellatus]KEO83814.1 hypothetical protein EL26_07810 [Tumebacillus flagellatus]
MTEPTLEKIDILRQRCNLSYAGAQEVLARNGGNVVKALIEMENTQGKPDVVEMIEERVTVMGHELWDKIQEIVRAGQCTKIRVLKNGRTVFTIPTAVGAVGAMLFPYITLIATVAAMAGKYVLVWDKRPLQSSTGPEVNTGHRPGVMNVHHEEIVETPAPAPVNS